MKTAEIFRKIFPFFTSSYFFLPLFFPWLLWSAGAVYYNAGDFFRLPQEGRLLLLGGYILLQLLFAAGCFFRKVFTFPILFFLLFLTFFYAGITPERSFRNTRWQTPWEKTLKVEYLSGNRVKLHNIRDFSYRTERDYTPRYISMTVALDQLQTIDLALSYWDQLKGIAHSMLSFGFSDGKYLVLSMETRLPQGSSQGFLPGIYKQYGLAMILGTERDLFRLRTHFRKEELYLYRTNATKEQAKRIFSAILSGAEILEKSPCFYNSITRNCTTSLAPLLHLTDPTLQRDFRLLFNGLSDEYLFELGYLAARKNETFPQLKKRRKVNQYSEIPGRESGEENYSSVIRQELL